MNKTIMRLGLLTGILYSVASLAQQSPRPETLTLSNFQFGPENRWAFSHIREVLPTVNIEHDSDRILVLERSRNFIDNFSIPFEGREQSIDEIVQSQFIDGLVVLKDGDIIFEQYYGHLTAERPHLMNSVSKSVVGLLAGKLADDRVIDLAMPVSHYVPALAKSGWGPDSLRTLLDMRDGSDYTEDYPDFSTTFRIQDCAVGWTDADYCPENGPRGGYEFFPDHRSQRSQARQVRIPLGFYRCPRLGAGRSDGPATGRVDFDAHLEADGRGVRCVHHR